MYVRIITNNSECILILKNIDGIKFVFNSNILGSEKII